MLDGVSEKHYSNPVAGFTKLFSSLIFSTVWREELHVKVVWITMLAMANRNGDVLASIPGLADAARVTLDQCQDALARLSAPDTFSRTKEHEGRRIEEVDGGWALLNYQKYREIRDADERRIQTREAVRRHRAKKADALTVSPVSHSKPRQAQAEADAEAEKDKPSAVRQVTWVLSMANDWCSTYGGTAPIGRIGKACKPLIVNHGEAIVFTHWGNYLRATEARYASPEGFANRFGAWGSLNGKPVDAPVNYEEACTMIRAAGLEVPPKMPSQFVTQAAVEKLIRRLREQVDA